MILIVYTFHSQGSSCCRKARTCIQVGKAERLTAEVIDPASSHAACAAGLAVAGCSSGCDACVRSMSGYSPCADTDARAADRATMIRSMVREVGASGPRLARFV